MKLIPDNFKDEVYRRVDSIKEKMRQKNMDSLLVGYNPNIYYTSGRFFRGYVLIMTSEPNPIWFVIKPSIYEKEEHVVSIRKPEDISEIIKEKGFPSFHSIGLELDSLSYSEITRLSKVFPDSEIVNGSVPLKEARMVKTDWELERMREDGRHHVNVYSQVKDCYKPGMTDLQFQIEIEKCLRLEGSIGFTRTAGNFMDINLGSVLAGDNADTPAPYDFTMGGSGVDDSLPGGANGHLLKEGETVMIDMNGAFNGYQTDMTRVWKLGEIPELAQKAHNCSIRILHELESLSKPGIPVADLYNRAVEIVAEEGLEAYFMGHKSQVAFIGHGLGIELNEPPVVMKKSKDILEKNMMIALEPKFVIPGVGAVGVENTYRVTDKGLENFTIYTEEIQQL